MSGAAIGVLFNLAIIVLWAVLVGMGVLTWAAVAPAILLNACGAAAVVAVAKL